MNNIYKCLCLLCLLSFALKLNAVPAKRLPVNLRLTDGTIVTARLFGDELLHFYLTTDGRALKQVAGTDDYEIVNRDSLCSIWSGRSAAR